LKRILILAVALVAMAAAAHADEWKPLAGGCEYAIQDTDTKGNPIDEPASMVILTPEPMMSDRLAVYGNITIDKSRQRVVNTEHEKKVTANAMEIYNRIMALQTKRGLFMVFSCTLEHTRIVIVKYRSVTWEELIAELDKILAIMDQSAQ